MTTDRRAFYVYADTVLVHVSVRKAGEASDEHQSRVARVARRLGATSVVLMGSRAEGCRPL